MSRVLRSQEPPPFPRIPYIVFPPDRAPDDETLTAEERRELLASDAIVEGKRALVARAKLLAPGFRRLDDAAWARRGVKLNGLAQ